ncbi:hypothetical protein FRC10_010580 [Ceratobasidium sp. 414]|nr:hypothetical protein FRC10_010580 [Ceratobasidium sp. 414]
MRASGLVLAVVFDLFRLVAARTGPDVDIALGNPGVERWRNGTSDGARPGLIALSRAKLASLALDSLSAPIITSPFSPHLASFSSHQCVDLTVDQLVHWAAHHSGRRVNSHGANVFDAPPTQVRSRAKRVASVELCEKMYRECVLGVIAFPQRDSSESEPESVESEARLDVDQQRLFASQIAQAEAAPHVFEPDTNPALDRAAKHSIYDLRALLDVFGVPWTEEDSHADLTEMSRMHTALWIGNV